MKLSIKTAKKAASSNIGGQVIGLFHTGMFQMGTALVINRSMAAYIGLLTKALYKVLVAYSPIHTHTL